MWREIGYSPSRHLVRSVDSAGYVWARVRGGGRYSEHRLVAIHTLGRALRPGEVVHHKNHKKADNRPENLQVCKSAKEHSQIHAGGGKSREYLLLVKRGMQESLKSLQGTPGVLDKLVEMTAVSV